MRELSNAIIVRVPVNIFSRQTASSSDRDGDRLLLALTDVQITRLPNIIAINVLIGASCCWIRAVRLFIPRLHIIADVADRRIAAIPAIVRLPDRLHRLLPFRNLMSYDNKMEPHLRNIWNRERKTLLVGTIDIAPPCAPSSVRRIALVAAYP